MASMTYEGYEALGPFFSIFKEGVQGRVDGDHFFDFLSDDIVWEFPYPLSKLVASLLSASPHTAL